MDVRKKKKADNNKGNGPGVAIINILSFFLKKTKQKKLVGTSSFLGLEDLSCVQFELDPIGKLTLITL